MAETLRASCSVIHPQEQQLWWLLPAVALRGRGCVILSNQGRPQQGSSLLHWRPFAGHRNRAQENRGLILPETLLHKQSCEIFSAPVPAVGPKPTLSSHSASAESTLTDLLSLLSRHCYIWNRR